jgi:hypothetical protein
LSLISFDSVAWSDEGRSDEDMKETPFYDRDPEANLERRMHLP